MLGWWSQRRPARNGARAAAAHATGPTHVRDLALAHRARDRDPQAIDELGNRLRCVPRFLARRNRRMGGPLTDEDLRDATQETVLVLWNKLGEFRGEAAFETWCYAIAGGVFMNAVRRTQRQRRIETLPDAEFHAALAVRDPAPPDDDPVHGCIARLPAADAFVVRARAFDEWSFEEIAEDSGSSVAALKARYYRALRKLQHCLGALTEIET